MTFVFLFLARMHYYYTVHDNLLMHSWFEVYRLRISSTPYENQCINANFSFPSINVRQLKIFQYFSVELETRDMYFDIFAAALIVI